MVPTMAQPTCTRRFVHRLAASPTFSARSHLSSPPPTTPAALHALLESLTAPSRLHLPTTLPSILSALSRARAAQTPLLPASRLLAASAFLRHNRLADALAHFNLLPDATALPSPLCNSLLAALSASGSLASARKVFDRMLARAVELDTVGFGVFVKNVGRREELGDVLRLVDEVGSLGDWVNRSVVAAMVADGLCREGRIAEAWRALEELRVRGWKPDFLAYRIVSEGFRSVGRVEEEARILKQKRKLGVAPRKEDYREFVLKLVSDRRIVQAKEIAEAIVLGDFPIDDDVLNALIGSVAEVDADAAIMFCKFMIGKERLPSAKTLVYLCRSICKNEKGDEMVKIFTLLLDMGYCTNARDYHLVVSFLGKAGKVREAYDVLKEMKRKRVEPDISSYNSLMESLCRNDLIRPAKKLWDEMFTGGCSANQQTYNILLTKFSEIGETQEALQLFNHMLQKGVEPDCVTYTSVISMLCREKKFQQAIEIFNKSVMQDARVASSVLTMFINALCKQGNFEAALHVISRVPSNIENLNSHVILLKSLTDSGEVQIAANHIKWVRNSCSSSFKKILNELMASLSTSASLEHVANLVRALHSQGLTHEVVPWLNLMEDGYA